MFDMEKYKVISTPMSTSCNLDKDENGKRVEENIYRGMIGYLLYLTTSHPNIMFVVCKWCTFSSIPDGITSHCGQTSHDISH